MSDCLVCLLVSSAQQCELLMSRQSGVTVLQPCALASPVKNASIAAASVIYNVAMCWAGALRSVTYTYPRYQLPQYLPRLKKKQTDRAWMII